MSPIPCRKNITHVNEWVATFGKLMLVLIENQMLTILVQHKRLNHSQACSECSSCHLFIVLCYLARCLRQQFATDVTLNPSLINQLLPNSWMTGSPWGVCLLA